MSATRWWILPVILAFAADLHAQSAEVRSRPLTHIDSFTVRTEACSCQIVLEETARIGGSVDPGHLVPYSSLAALSNGAFVIASYRDGVITKYTHDGGFAGQIGGTGAGPGELRHVTSIMIGPGDTIYAMDYFSRWLNRMIWSGAFVDKTLLPGGIRNWIPLGGRRIFASALIPTRSAFGYPLHILDSLGIVKSVGNSGSVSRHSGSGRELVRYLAAGENQRTWVGHRHRYRIELWRNDGRLEHILKRNVPWFPAADLVDGPRSPQEVRPLPTIRGMHQDGKFLWVYILVADKDWKKQPLKPSPVKGMMQPESDLNPFFDTVIELIDLERNAVIASTRHQHMLTPIGNGYLSSYQEDAVGQPTYIVWKHAIVPPPNR